MEYDAEAADFFVYVQRDSSALLSVVGHDLKIRVDEFSIDVDLDGESVAVRVDADSLEPVDAIDWESRRETGSLSDGDREKIARSTAGEVLEADAYPEIAFESTDVESTDDGWRVTGELDLHGEVHEIEADVLRDEGGATVEKTIDQTEWGIEPYSAMLGSLKVAPEVVVTLELPLPDEA